MQDSVTFVVRSARQDEIDVLVDIDEDSGALFASMGIDFSALTPDHPYVRKERIQWLASIDRGDAYLALGTAGDSLGILVMDYLDGAPYLEQLSVRMRAMRRGLGTALLRRGIEWATAHGSELWLTTYGHVPWNRPYYERFGFTVVPECECAPQMQACLEAQRSALPLPQQRVAMRHRVR
jgi:GNAT superfamily N-acetyltransferase